MYISVIMHCVVASYIAIYHLHKVHDQMAVYYVVPSVE